MSDAPANEPDVEIEIPDQWEGMTDDAAETVDAVAADEIDDPAETTDESDDDGGTDEPEPRRFVDPDSVDE